MKSSTYDDLTLEDESNDMDNLIDILDKQKN